MQYTHPELVNQEMCNYPYEVYKGDKWFSPDMFSKKYV